MPVRSAAQSGSWGVGRIFFRARTDSTRIFDLYYDRAPRSARQRKGGWYLFRELRPAAGGEDLA